MSSTRQIVKTYKSITGPFTLEEKFGAFPTTEVIPLLVTLDFPDGGQETDDAFDALCKSITDKYDSVKPVTIVKWGEREKWANYTTLKGFIDSADVVQVAVKRKAATFIEPPLPKGREETRVLSVAVESMPEVATNDFPAEPVPKSAATDDVIAFHIDRKTTRSVLGRAPRPPIAEGLRAQFEDIRGVYDRIQGPFTLNGKFGKFPDKAVAWFLTLHEFPEEDRRHDVEVYEFIVNDYTSLRRANIVKWSERDLSDDWTMKDLVDYLDSAHYHNIDRHGASERSKICAGVYIPRQTKQTLPNEVGWPYNVCFSAFPGRELREFFPKTAGRKICLTTRNGRHSVEEKYEREDFAKLLATGSIKFNHETMPDHLETLKKKRQLNSQPITDDGLLGATKAVRRVRTRDAATIIREQGLQFDKPADVDEDTVLLFTTDIEAKDCFNVEHESMMRPRAFGDFCHIDPEGSATTYLALAFDRFEFFTFDLFYRGDRTNVKKALEGIHVVTSIIEAYAKEGAVFHGLSLGGSVIREGKLRLLCFASSVANAYLKKHVEDDIFSHAPETYKLQAQTKVFQDITTAASNVYSLCVLAVSIICGKFFNPAREMDAHELKKELADGKSIQRFFDKMLDDHMLSLVNRHFGVKESDPVQPVAMTDEDRDSLRGSLGTLSERFMVENGQVLKGDDGESFSADQQLLEPSAKHEDKEISFADQQLLEPSAPIAEDDDSSRVKRVQGFLRRIPPLKGVRASSSVVENTHDKLFERVVQNWDSLGDIRDCKSIEQLHKIQDLFPVLRRGLRIEQHKRPTAFDVMRAVNDAIGSLEQ